MANKSNNKKTDKDIAKYIKDNLNKKDIKNFFDIAGVASAYEIVTNGIPEVYEGTHQFVRDIQVSQLLKEKFHNMPYDSAEGFKVWLESRLSGSVQSQANALNRIQGDGAGEVDFIREMQGKLRSLFTKTDYIRENGSIASNTAGIDTQEVNRFTGEVINKYQIKTLRSSDSIKNTLKKFVNNNEYNSDITLVGPKELIDEAKSQGLPNPTRVMGSIEENAESAQKLKEKIESGNMATEITLKNAGKKIAGGAIIGAGISIGISTLFAFIDYKNGKIDKKEMSIKIGKEGTKGAITGGALSGLSLFVPGGIIGFGVGLTAGTLLRNSLDDAFGDGVFGEVLELTNSVQANIKMLSEGSIYIADLIETDGELMEKAIDKVDNLRDERLKAIKKMQNLEGKYHNGQFITSDRSINEILNNLDAKKANLEG